MPVQKRLISLEYLRGVAALMVLYAHVIIVGITDPATPKTFLPFMPGTAIDQGSITGLSYYLYPEIWAHTIGASFGYIGVSLFFLISGFVIVGSIERLPPTKFLIGRFFRIIPACAVVVAGSALFFGMRYGSPIYTGANALTSAALVPWVNGNIQMIPVLWSLIVEAWFYVMIAGLFMWRRRIDTPTLLLGATICLLVVVVGALYPARWVTSAPFMRHAAYNCSFILNILVGAAIFNFRRGELIWVCAAIFIAFWASRLFFEGVNPELATFHISNSLCGLAIFTCVLLLGDKIRYSSVAKFFADVSYPLYLMHVPLAWLLLFKFAQYGISPALNFVLTIGVCLTLSLFLHVAIEGPAQRLGKRLARAKNVASTDAEGLIYPPRGQGHAEKRDIAVAIEGNLFSNVTRD